MADELKPAYLIAGSDRPKVDRAVARLRARFDADAVELHDAATTTADDAVAACNALGLFGAGTRLVVVEGVEAWKAPEAKVVADLPQVAGARHDARARRPGELRKDAPLAKAVARVGRGPALGRRAERPYRAGSPTSSSCTARRADPEACRLLVELVGDDLYELASEVEKLATWAGGDGDHRGGRRAARRAARRVAAA